MARSPAEGPIPVLLVIDKLGAGGAQTHVCHLASELDRARFAPRVCCLKSGGGLADRLRERGVPVSVLGVDRIYGPRALLGLAALVRQLRRERIQLVHTFLVSSNVFGTVAARLAGVPVVVTSRRDSGFSRSERLGAVEEWLINPLADRVVAVSDAVAAVSGRERALAGKVLTIPNGVGLQEDAARQLERDAYRAEWGVLPREKVVGCVARLVDVKGLDDLLTAAADILAADPGVRFVLVGDGPLRSALESQARSLGIGGHVVMAGTRSDVRGLLHAFDVAVLASHTEGMSNVLLEYMATGLPVVATAVGGNVEVLQDGVTGRLVPPRDPAALASAVRALLSDAEEAARLGHSARAFARENLSLERMVQRHEDLYQLLLQRTRRAA